MDLNAPECSVDGKSKSIPTANESLPSIGQTSADTMTSEHGRNQKPNELTLSAEDFPVRTSQTQALSEDLPEREAVCGEKCTVSFANYDHVTQLWRTLQRCLIEGMSEFSETWPRAGLMVSGKCYRRAPSVHHIHEKGCFTFSTLTVVSCEHPGRQKIKPHQQSCLSAELAMRDRWAIGGQLNPNHAAWFMGFPESWTDLDHTETPLSPKSPNGSDDAS